VASIDILFIINRWHSRELQSFFRKEFLRLCIGIGGVCCCFVG
jgi:hypothetical protein